LSPRPLWPKAGIPWTPLGPLPSVTPVTAVVLAGGLARRMSNVDKGLQLLEGRPLVAWVLQRLARQVGEVLINANRNPDVYATFGHRVVEDRIGGFAGPLAGMHAGLSEAGHELVAFVPCDTPFLPEDLIPRLLAPLANQSVDLSVAKTGTQPHPVICLMRKRLLPHLTAYLDGGGRKVDGWYSTLNVTEVAFDDQPSAFSNINTPEELRTTNIDADR
jgi:molybdopterin-guanine dinucleotide biosynthesis protein A